jgi:hypothetical protein
MGWLLPKSDSAEAAGGPKLRQLRTLPEFWGGAVAWGDANRDAGGSSVAQSAFFKAAVCNWTDSGWRRPTGNRRDLDLSYVNHPGWG